ncbi:MAG: TonB-dependent receptor [Proteobacteria bacterium]|nr:TonB-dependent receptor [Pseudomonadota bacterium]
MASSAMAAALIVLAQPTPVLAQQISSSVRGQLTANSDVVPGATVSLINTKTGAKQTTTSSESGAFAFAGLDVGGPYTLVVSATGYDKKTITGIYLTVGETSSLSVDLAALDIETVVVSGARETAAATAIVESRGLATSFTAKDIKNTPTIERDLKDIVQKTPYAYVDPVGGGSSPPVPTLNIAGSNGRCSNLLVDGLQQKDNFGLNSQGYPTARAPIPNDWAEQIQVAVTPYDVQYNDTCGGIVNVVTKSGSNDFHGTSYFYYKDAGLGGDGLAPFVERSYGATLSGPILEDRLFFFVGYDELQRTSSPANSAIGPNGSGYPTIATNISQAQVDQVASIAQSIYGFNAGNFADNFTEYNQRYIAKLTWQIDDNQRLVATYQHTAGGTLATGGGSTSSVTPAVAMPSNWYIDAEKLEAYSLQYYANWGNNLSTEVDLGQLHVHGDQTPLGGTNFPEVFVRTPGANGVYDLGTSTTSNNASDDGYIILGPDIYRHYNFLTYKNDYAKAVATYTLDTNTLKAGFEFHRIGIVNSFLPGAQSVVRFDSISDFQNGIVAQTIDTRSNFSRSSFASGNAVYFASGIGGDPSTANANFKFEVGSLYLQDEWFPSDDLSVQVGLRYDRYFSDDHPVLNPYFQTRYGFTNQRTVDGLNTLLPRFSASYNWRPDLSMLSLDDSLIRLRAGIARYSGGFQTVWISNSYANTGITSLTTFGTPGQPAAGPCTSAAPFACVPTVMPTDHATWVQDLVNGPLSTASVQQTSTVNAILPNFRLPNIWRANLGFDWVFGPGIAGDNWILKFDYLSEAAQAEPYWTNLRIEPSATRAPDGRIIYQWTFDQAAGRPDPVGTAGQLKGTDLAMGSADGGGSSIFVIGASNSWQHTLLGDIDFDIGYTHTKASEISPDTSSTASSSYLNEARVNFNEAEVGTSDYERVHRFTTNVTFTERLFDELETRLNLFAQRMSGQHFSYVFNGNPFGAGTLTGRSLVYVPAVDPATGMVTALSDPNVTYAGGFDLAGFNTMLRQTGLIKYAGHIAPRNSGDSPWSTLVNMGVEQELPSVFEGHRLVASLDIFNLGNLINKDWGKYATPNFYQAYNTINASIVGGKYQYNSFSSNSTIQSNIRERPITSTYQIQIGIRYEF